MIYYPLVVIMFLINCFADAAPQYVEGQTKSEVIYTLFQIIMLNLNYNSNHSTEYFTGRELIVPVDHNLLLVRGYGLEGIQEATGNNRFVGSQQQRQVESSCSKIRQVLGIFTETRNEVSFIVIFSFPLKLLNI